jgi:hypothetical protein
MVFAIWRSNIELTDVPVLLLGIIFIIDDEVKLKNSLFKALFSNNSLQ